MVSYIYISTKSQTGIEKIKEQTNKLNIAPIDHVILELETGDKSSTSIGIAEVKRLLQKVYLKPMQSPSKAIIIKDAQILTTEAQNALLKILEEPPAHTYIYLLTTSLNSLLSTIQSRCSISDLNQEYGNYQQNTITIPKSIGERLALAEKNSKQKTIAIEFLQKLLIKYHNKLFVDTNPSKLVKQIRLIEKSLQLLQTTNVNPRLTIEHALLGAVMEE